MVRPEVPGPGPPRRATHCPKWWSVVWGGRAGCGGAYGGADDGGLFHLVNGCRSGGGCGHRAAGHPCDAAPTPPANNWNRAHAAWRRRPPQVAERFTATHLAGIENGIGVVNTRVLGLVSPRRRYQVVAAATIDGDTTDVEVYGRDKQDAVYNYQGHRAYRPHVAFWAEGAVSLAADLMKADEDPRRVAAQLLDRAIAQLPPGVAKIRSTRKIRRGIPRGGRQTYRRATPPRRSPTVRGRSYRSELFFLAKRIDGHLVRWAMYKFNRLRGKAR